MFEGANDAQSHDSAFFPAFFNLLGFVCAASLRADWHNFPARHDT
jgi:hypothetical protein